MKLKLENIGMLRNAEIEIKGISLIAGPNDSGKSTISKMFYSIVRGLNLKKKAFESWKNETIKKDYQEVLRVLRANDIKLDNIITNDINKEWIEKIKTYEDKVTKSKHQKSEFGKSIHRLNYYLNLDFDSKEAREEEIFQYLSLEFKKQVSSVFKEKESTIKITDIEGETEFTINEYYTLNNNKIIELSKNIDLYYNDAFYIESPLIIDSSIDSFVTLTDIEDETIRDRKVHLKKTLSNQIANPSNINESSTKKISEVLEDIQKVINGEIIIDPIDGISYKKQGQDINIDNVAVGIKSFGILQLLLKMNRLNSRTLLIIDEPEIHLHPNWQIKYAETLVILSKELDVPILLASHSPYFIEALDTYSKKYNFQSSVNFYYTKKSKNNLTSNLINSTEDISPLLETLTDAYYTLKEVEDEFEN